MQQKRQPITPRSTGKTTQIKPPAVKSGPVPLTEQSLKQVAGGTSPAGPNGGW
jgi:hypothetical protein